MISRKTMVWVLLSVCAFTAAYLWYVKEDREAGIKKYCTRPQLGDIYTMRQETHDHGVTVFYLKIKDIGAERIYFYPSRLVAGAPSDIFLKHFDTAETRVYSKKELADIVNGRWNVPEKDYTSLIEIQRN